ncbi:GumC family protein [Celeribacter sp. ULVN23_4]
MTSQTIQHPKPNATLAHKKRRGFFRRALMGGGLTDLRRLPRYVWFCVLGLAAIWAPISGYLKTAAPVYASHMSLILPGSGSASSVNLADIGQASSHANSAFSSNSISPTETYKRLLAADRVIAEAATQQGVAFSAFGKPQVQLVDQTAFIHVKLIGPSPEAAQARNAALLDAFFAEIDRLRSDEMDSRQSSGLDAIQDYRASVAKTRVEIEQLRTTTGLNSVDQYKRQLDEADALRAKIDITAAEHERKVAMVRGLETRLGTNSEHASRILRLNADTAYLALLEAMALATADLAEMQSRYGQRHPEVLKARNGMEAARAKAEARAVVLTGEAGALERSLDGGRAALLTELVRQDSERSGLQAELKELRALLTVQTDRLDRLAPEAARLEDLQRDFNVAEAVFASAIARSQSSKADVFASYPLVQVLEDPTLPDRPTSPRKKLAIAAGMAASLLLFVALSLGWIRRFLIQRLIKEKGRAA